MTNTHRARRKDHTVDVNLQQQAPLPPPSATAASATPIMPQAASERAPARRGGDPAGLRGPTR